MRCACDRLLLLVEEYFAYSSESQMLNGAFDWIEPDAEYRTQSLEARWDSREFRLSGSEA